MHFHSLQLSLRHQDLSTEDNFEKSSIAETLEEDEEYDALTYTTVRDLYAPSGILGILGT